MVRTQIYLDDHQPRTIKLISKSSKRSESEVVRQALEIGLRQLQQGQRGNADVFLGLGVLGKKLDIHLPSDLSTNVDDYLYGSNE